MKNVILVLILFFLVTAVTPRAWAADYYVSKSGNNANPGTGAQPWKTIQKAANTMTAGDTVYIKAGTYNERVVPKNSGTAGNYITYTNYNNDTVTIDGTGVSIPSGWGGLLEISEVSCIKISGLTIRDAQPDDNHNGILLEDSSYIIIENNHTYNTASSGIGVWDCSNIIIDNNEVELACNDGEQECISVGGTDTFEIRNNHVHHGGPGTIGGEGICLKDGSSNGKAYNNHVHHLNRLGIYMDAWDKHTYNIEVYGNLVHDIDGNDCFTFASESGGLLENITVYNNIGYNADVLGINVSLNGYPNISHPMKDITIINNTFYNNGGGGWGGGIAVENPNVQNLVIRNNIVSRNLTFQIEVEPNVSMSKLTIDHNLIHGYRGYGDEVRGTDYVEGNPLFVNASSADFHLQENSPAIDAGSAIGAPSDDYEGNSRPRGGGYDIGAYEYVVSNGTGAEISLSRTVIDFTTLAGSTTTMAETFTISNSGTGALDWSVGDDASWLGAGPTSGTGTGVVTLTVAPSGLGVGSYTGIVTVSASNASNSPQTLTVNLTVNGTIQGCPLFPADNIWNTPVDTLPLDSNSSRYTNTIGADETVHADFGSGLWDGGPIGIPFTTVPGTQEKVAVTFYYDDESDPGPYPIPADAPIEGGGDSDGDRHVLVVDRDNCILYELYDAHPQPNGSWTAGSGAIFDLNANDLRPAGWTSADAAGLPILPGLVRYEEVAAGEIKHAIRFTAPQTRKHYIWPARHYASSLTGTRYPPMGQRFRLKADFDISGFSTEVQVILRALKKYGMILADNGSSWFISGVPDERWDNDVLHELHNVRGSDFEAVDESSLMIDPDSAQAQQPGQPEQPTISLDRTQLNFGAVISGAVTAPQTFSISPGGTGTLNWTIADNADWLSVSPTSGTNSGVVTVSIHASGLSAGTYTGTITIADPNAANSPQTVTVTLTVKHASLDMPPLGTFETPIHGSTVRSSIPVTGWALDDTGVESVKIYRRQGGQLVYIGDAIFVEGARPDIETAYPGYPLNYRAGWGYMMLTNFLPDSGNGTFTIHAVAADSSGQSVTLGTKTITCDNANAVKPFGAIDTPMPGSIASGTGYRNHGWVLTPLPNSIPTDGSTINVYVDGVDLGHPVYNIYRPDIAALFPGYANSDGAHAYFDMDTTAFTNGVHTIAWIAEDNAGNSDGIGSRYFTVQNVLPSATRGALLKNCPPGPPAKLFISTDPVGIVKGYEKDREFQTIYPDYHGNIMIEIKELERLEMHLDNSRHSLFCFGYHMVNHQLRPLPIGSTLDAIRGVFYWQPGPGFTGEYQFVFFIKQENGQFHRKNITVKIKYYKY